MSGLWKDPLFGGLAADLYRRYGLVFEGGQGQLFRKRISRRAEELGYADVGAYVGDVKSGVRQAEHERLVELLTVNETYFFREEEHFRIILEELWPEWVRGGEEPIRIWSAGCSIGCEAYTLAILLHEKGLLGPGRPRVEIVGTDVNARVLEEAKDALYSDFALRSTSPYYRKKYFTVDGQLHRLIPEVRAAVAFRRFNLLRPEVPFSSGWFHSIFCRNVLIYFDADAKQRAVEVLARSLRPGGALVVGRSESLFTVAGAPPFVKVGGVLIHRKQGACV